MAVEIPVYVDIQGAFDRAVREIPKEMPKLEKVLSSHALNMKIDYGGGGFRTVRDLLTDTAMDAEELENALKRVRKAFDDAVAKGASKKNTSATVNNLAKAYGLLEQRAKGFYDSNAVAAMRLEDTIAKVTYKIRDMSSQLASLAPGSADKYNKINYELQIQRKRLAELTIQQMKYKAGIDASTEAYQKQSGIVKQLTGYFSSLYAVHSLVRFVKQVRDVTGELEYQRVALGHLLQDADFGNELFAKTVEAAKESPFRIGQLVTYTKQLAAYRIEQENLFDTTQRLADISAGLGVDMNRLILAFGQVRAASVLRGQELRQFTEAGIPLVELLAEKFRELGREGTTTADVFKLISERAVPFEYIKEIFEDLTNAGGMFYKMQEEQAKTLKGRWEKLKDAYDQALMSLGDSSTFQSWNDTILSILNGLAKNLNGIVRIVNAASMAWAAYWVTTKSGLSYGARLTGMFIKEYGAVKTLTFGVAGLTAAFRKLWLAMKANWVGIAVGAITGLITLFTTFKNKTKEAKEELSDMERAIADMKEANKEFGYQKGIISSYESLSNITEKTATQSKQLASAVEELKRAYPELADKIGDTNVPLAEQVELLKDAAEKAHQTAVDRAKAQLNTQKELIRGYRAENDAAKQAMETAQRRLETAQYIEAHPVVGGGSPEQLAKRTNEAAEAARKAEEAYEGAAEALAKAIREEAELRKLAFPEEVKNAMAEWQNLLIGASKYTSEGIPKLLFTDKDVQSWDSLGEAIKKLKPQFKEAKETYEGLVNAVKEGGALVRPELTKERDAAGEAFDAWKALDVLLGGLLSTNKKTGSDTRVSNLKKDISEITNAYKKFLELRKYMSDSKALNEIGILFPQLKGWEPSFDETIKKLQQMRDDVAAKLARSPKDKTLWEMQRILDTEISNLKFDDLKKKTDDELKRVSDEIKRSETARNFYKNILDMTGDEDLAANMTVSVYGDAGNEFKDRMQQQLDAAFRSLDWSELPDDVFGQLAVAVSNQDFNAILDKLELFPEEWRKALKQMASDNEKYNADYLSDLYKTYQKAKTFDQRRREVSNREAQKRAEIEANSNLTDEQKAEFTAASRKKEAKDLAEINVEELKNTYEWTKAFEDLDRVGSVTLVNLREKIEAIIEAQKDIMTPEDLKALTEALTKIRDTQTQRDPITAFASSGRKAALLAPAVFSKQGSKAYDKAIEKIKKFNEQAKETDKIDLDHLQDAFTASVDDIEKGAQAVANYASQWKGVIDTISDVFELDEIPILGETIDGVSSALGVVAAIIPVITVETMALSAAANSIPFVAILTAIVATLGAIIGMIKGIINAKVERLNQKIETQKEYVNDLERAYDRLGKAIEKSFGTDYIENYRKSLENLAAQQAAYQEQARLEREKGKKSDEKKAREYEEAAVDVTEKIEDAQGQIAEFFAGTDLTSAAKDFASAWLDAYREFGSITTAMKEKFQDMLGDMVENAMFAQLAQTILRPFYDEINRRADDGQLSAKDVADIASMVPDYIESLNGAFTVAANQLQAYGYNLRETAGTMTGISRSIAGASEESINGLAAGINTQNFYMQHLDANVALILSYLTGGATTAGASVTGEVVDPYKDVVLKNVAFIPSIDRNLAELLTEVRRVIKPRDAARSSSHVLVTNL